MRLVFRPIIRADLADALDCVPDSYYGDEDMKEALIALWGELLSRDMAAACCIQDLDEDFGRPIVAAAFAFAVPQAIADEVAGGSWPHIAQRILEPSSMRHFSVLDAAEIASANAGRGLDLVVAQFGALPSICDDRDADPILDRLEQLLHYLANGFRLRGMLVEVFSEQALRMALAMRLTQRASLSAAGQAPSAKVRSYVAGITAPEAAWLRGTSTASLFTYQAPVLGLAASQRQVLLFAIGGMTDQELAQRLCISYATVRKRWDQVYRKASIHLPHLCGSLHGAGRGRGSEKRRRILRYVENRPAEMRPYPARSAWGQNSMPLPQLRDLG